MTVDRRPPPVTLACVLAGAVGFLLVVNVLEVLSDWGSIELQEAIESALASNALASQDISVTTVLSVLRVALHVVLLASIALVVFAIFAVRGDRASRWGLTFLGGTGAVLLATMGGLAGLLPAILLSSTVFVLWTPEARVWFDVRNDRTPPPALVARAEARLHRVRPDGDRSGAPQRPPESGGPPPPTSGGTPPPMPGRPAGHRPTPGPTPRATPGSVVAAAITMLVGSLVVASSTGLTALLLALRELDPEGYDEFVAQSPPLDDALGQLGSERADVALTLLVLVVLTLVAVLAALAAIALLLGRRRAYVPALVLSWLGGIASAVAFPVGLPITVAALATVLLLRRPEVRAWAGR